MGSRKRLVFFVVRLIVKTKKEEEKEQGDEDAEKAKTYLYTF